MSNPKHSRPTALIWLRRDLRLADNPALSLALERGLRPELIYIDDPAAAANWRDGAAARAWLRRSLMALAEDVQKLGGRLTLRRGDSLGQLLALIDETGAAAVFWNRRYEPAHRLLDARIKIELRARDIEVESCPGNLLIEPWQMSTQSGTPYRVFTPFWRKAAIAFEQIDPPSATPETLPASCTTSACVAEQFIEAPQPRWDGGFWQIHEPGERAAWRRLAVFLSHVSDYQELRDRPDLALTSRLSAHLAFGEITPRQLLFALRDRLETAQSKGVLGFIRELAWREFAHHLLFHFPESPDNDLTGAMFGFPWAEPDREQLDAWKQGRTGIPMVDAGMRELWATGAMHNRSRMIVSSFLTKNLRFHWLHGARWFWDTLVDADLANNTQGWQWSAGTGADAAPYFRVFNPVTQGKRFDPEGDYVRRWLPELDGVSQRAVQQPWLEPQSIAGDYPRQPIVDLASTRESALAAWKQGREVRSMLRD